LEQCEAVIARESRKETYILFFVLQTLENSSGLTLKKWITQNVFFLTKNSFFFILNGPAQSPVGKPSPIHFLIGLVGLG
jgi:hypothetical protein